MPDADVERAGYDSTRYLALPEEGLIDPDDRTELLEGVIVAMAPQSPLHATAIWCVGEALREAFPAGTWIRIQQPLVTDVASVPEPDIAVLAANPRDFIDRHPGAALLVVEIAVATVAQDRLTKSRIYARAGVPDYWIVHPGQEWVETYRQPDCDARLYRRIEKAVPGAVLELDSAPGVRLPASRLFPRRAL